MPKVKIEGEQDIRYLYYQSDASSIAQSFRTGPNRITYDTGRPVNGHYPWKECVHDSYEYDPRAGSQSCMSHNPTDGNTRTFYGMNTQTQVQNILFPSTPFDDSVKDSILNQIDLNKGESTLLYSGVVQALPFLGAATKLSSILNEAARKFAKDLRRKPFTTAVKSLISADFVDRFVISPTIDDARRFADAVNYVIRTVTTAQQRNYSLTALRSRVKTVHKDEARVLSPYGNFGGAARLGGILRSYSYSESQCFALLAIRYNLTAAAPINLWMRRTGVTRPLDSAWDLVPFSFVIDYFTRTGDFISHLMDKMSDDEGLKGKILAIKDIWYTHKQSGECYVADPYWVNNAIPVPHSGDWVVDYNTKELRTPRCKRVHFERKRVLDPWGFLSPAPESVGDYLTINTNLSKTRKRTIAELIIQAKL